jgi:hypothetical protein
MRDHFTRTAEPVIIAGDLLSKHAPQPIDQNMKEWGSP